MAHLTTGRLRLVRTVALAVAILLAGCVAREAPIEPSAEHAPTLAPTHETAALGPVGPPPALVFPACMQGPPDARSSCSEPTVAVDAEGRAFVTTVLGDHLARSLDGGATWEAIAPPGSPPDAPQKLGSNDATVVVDGKGRLYLYALGIAPGMPSLLVSRSDDGGDSWALRRVVWPGAPKGLSVALQPDRPWMAFGPADDAYLMFRDAPTGLWSMRSEDAGATWAPPVLVASTPTHGLINTGAPWVASDGRVLIPFFTSFPSNAHPLRAREGSPLGLAISSDRGETWTASIAFRSEDPQRAASMFPQVIEDAGGGIHLAWLSPEGTIRLASSDDGARTWADPVDLSAPGAAVGPWGGAPATGGVDVLWFESAEEGFSLVRAHAARPAGPEGFVRTLVATGIPFHSERMPAGTDFTHAAWLPDGCPVAVWASEEGIEAARGCP